MPNFTVALTINVELKTNVSEALSDVDATRAIQGEISALIEQVKALPGVGRHAVLMAQPLTEGELQKLEQMVDAMHGAQQGHSAEDCSICPAADKCDHKDEGDTAPGRTLH